MLSKSQFKFWVRSRSLRFALESRSPRGTASGGVGQIQWNGHSVYYRIGTSDQHVIYSVLLKGGKKSEYWIPRPIRPATILDIGANIGAAALYFARTYPQARVFSFEPIAANYSLLQRNSSPYTNIRAFNLALGPRDETIQLIASPDERNLGGYSMFQRGATAECERISVECRAIADVLSEIGGKAPDLIKIDTEGAEYRILTALPEQTLSQVMWIVGELHGENDFELLNYLSRWFEIGIRKSVERALCNFHARNRNRVP